MMARKMLPEGEVKRYVVNLDRSKERMAWFDRQAADRSLAFERVPAVDGSRLSEVELVSCHRRCRPDRSISFGELGCFLSHIHVWRRMVGEGTPWAFIAEDDLHFGQGSERFLEGDDWLTSDVDIVKAETMLTTVEMSADVLAAPFGHDLRLLRSFHGGSAGYFLSQAGAARLLAFAEIHCEPVDHFIFAPSHPAGHGLAVAQIDPAICIQDDQLAHGGGLTSDLDPERDKFLRHHPLSRKPRGVQKLVREVRRVAGYCAGALRRLASTASGASVFRPVPIQLGATLVTERKRRKTASKAMPQKVG
jgi:glycosyl transferase family 25